MNGELAQEILNELARRVPVDQRLADKRFAQQHAFVTDSSNSIAAQCTRRAGKSFGIGLRLYRAALKYPASTPLYIALTRKSAHDIMWPVMVQINNKFGLGAVPTESALTVSLPNQSQISLVGADMKNFIERLRGPKYPEVCIDEAGSFRSHLKSLIEDILEPATLDYNGSIVLAGTPGVVPSGVFFDATQGTGGYSVHKWTLYQNPYLPNAQDFVDRIKKKRKWTNDNPTYQREYLGKWVIDLDALVYKFKKEKNLYAELPRANDYVRILGVDYGWNDATALAVVGYSHTSRRVYIEHVEGHSEIIPSDIAQRINQLRDRFKPTRIVADTGGLGKSITEEFIRRYHIPIQAAEKRDKLSHIALMNGDFIDGNLFVHESLTELHDQYQTLTKGDDNREDPRLPNDLCDATLYAYTLAKHYLGKEREPRLPEGSAQWAEKEAKRLERAEIERFEQQNRKQEWWEQ